MSAADLARFVFASRPHPQALQRGKDAETFRDWWAGWLAGPAGATALRAFDAAREPETLSDARATDEAICTLHRMAHASYFAATYLRDEDPGERYRAELIAARLRAASLARSARDLAAGFGGGHPGLDWALCVASAAAGVGSERPDIRRDVGEMWTKFFAELHETLKGKLPELNGRGPWFRLYTVGNLHFGTSKLTGRKIGADTMLLFELVFHLRKWKSGRAVDGWQTAQPMPSGPMNKASYSAAAAFIRASLGGKALTPEQARQRLRALPSGVGLIGWPHEAPR